MPTYKVILGEVELYLFKGIEAETEKEAEDKAWELLEEDRENSYYRSDRVSKVIEQ